jgi:GDPmannose 4,6-dehydratase
LNFFKAALPLGAKGSVVTSDDFDTPGPTPDDDCGAWVKDRCGAVDVSRDWGYVPEYVEAMWRMLQQEEPQDFVIATGESHTLEELTSAAFSCFNLDWRDHVDIDPSLFRASEIAYSRGNPEKSRKLLGLEAEAKFEELVPMLVEKRGRRKDDAKT